MKIQKGKKYRLNFKVLENNNYRCAFGGDYVEDVLDWVKRGVEKSIYAIVVRVVDEVKVLVKFYTKQGRFIREWFISKEVLIPMENSIKKVVK